MKRNPGNCIDTKILIALVFFVLKFAWFLIKDSNITVCSGMAWEFPRASPLARHLLQCRLASEVAARLGPSGLPPPPAPDAPWSWRRAPLD